MHHHYCRTAFETADNITLSGLMLLSARFNMQSRADSLVVNLAVGHCEGIYLLCRVFS